LFLWLFDKTKVQFVFYLNSIKRTKVKINKNKPVADCVNHNPKQRVEKTRQSVLKSEAC